MHNHSRIAFVPCHWFAPPLPWPYVESHHLTAPHRRTSAWRRLKQKFGARFKSSRRATRPSRFCRAPTTTRRRSPPRRRSRLSSNNSVRRRRQRPQPHRRAAHSTTRSSSTHRPLLTRRAHFTVRRHSAPQAGPRTPTSSATRKTASARQTAIRKLLQVRPPHRPPATWTVRRRRTAAAFKPVAATRVERRAARRPTSRPAPPHRFRARRPTRRTHQAANHRLWCCRLNSRATT